MADFPKDGSTLSFEKITDPLVRAVKFAYDIKRKNRDKDIPWKGPEIGQDDRACCLLAAQSLKSKNLIYSEEDQGREAIEEIIGLAVRLGIEQGRRIYKESGEMKIMELHARLGERYLQSLAEQQKTEG